MCACVAGVVADGVWERVERNGVDVVGIDDCGERKLLVGKNGIARESAQLQMVFQGRRADEREKMVPSVG